MSMTAQTNMPKPPSHFVCPLTKELMKDPMMSRYGNHFERSAILNWLNEGHNYCPVTHKPLRPSNLISDKTMRFKIQSWVRNQKDQQSVDEESSEDESAIDRLVSSAQIALPPSHFICPLTKEVMKDPVMTKTGMNYERSAILKYLEQKEYMCPVTKKSLKPSGVISNSKLAWEIGQWNISHGSGTIESGTVGKAYGKKSSAGASNAPLYHLLSTNAASSLRQAGLAQASAKSGSQANDEPRNNQDLTDILEDVMATLQV